MLSYVQTGSNLEVFVLNILHKYFDAEILGVIILGSLFFSLQLFLSLKFKNKYIKSIPIYLLIVTLVILIIVFIGTLDWIFLDIIGFAILVPRLFAPPIVGIIAARIFFKDFKGFQ